MNHILIPIERIEQKIFIIRGQKVMLSFDLAALYQVEPRILIQAVKRNIQRFPKDFMFQLTWEEASFLMSHFVTSKMESPVLLRSQFVILKRGQHIKHLPFAFTEQGVAMLSSVLRSPRAIRVNIVIMRTFVRLRAMLAKDKMLAEKMEGLEKKYEKHETQIQSIFDAIEQLTEHSSSSIRKIGFKVEGQKKHGFTLLEMILSLGLLSLFLSLTLGQRTSITSFVRPLEKADILQRIRSAQITALVSSTPQKVDFQNRQISFGSSGLPQPGSSGTFTVSSRSGRPFRVVLSSMGRSRIQ